MKYLILVGDGMGDFPLAELGGRTPLEVAATPTIDELCSNGEFFLNHTVPDGFPPGSDVANLSLLGYAPERYYTGRAPLEAAAMGIRLADDETAFRCNFVTIDRPDDNHVTMVDFAAGHISTAEGHELIAALERECADDTFHFHPGVSYRNLVVVRGAFPELATVPPHDWIEKDVTSHWQRYLGDEKWRNLLLRVSATLAAHPVNRQRIRDGKNPANAVWLWGEGKMPTAPTLQDRYHIRGSMISAVDLLKGLGVIAGLSVINVPGATGYLDTNYEGKAQAAIAALASGQDFVFVHLEAPDEAGHQGSASAKIQAIQDFDRRIVGPIIGALRAAGTDFRVVVTMDHFTPISLRTHTSDPVPALLYDSRETQPKSGRRFTEKECLLHDQHHKNSLSGAEMFMDKLFCR